MNATINKMVGMLVLAAAILAGQAPYAAAQVVSTAEIDSDTLSPDFIGEENSIDSESPDIDEDAPCTADLDGDGEVGHSDLALALGSYGRCRRCEADFNSDSVVDAVDLAYVLGQWGTCGASESPRYLSCATRSRIEPELRTHAAAVPIVQFSGSEHEIDSCLGDLDEDGTVGRDDIAILFAAMERDAVTIADLNDDGYVDRMDLDALLRHYGPCAESRSALSYDDGESPSPTPEETCVGDMNGDDTVDATDLAHILGAAGRCRRCEEDVNDDTYINQIDMALVLGNWGSCR